MKKTFIKLPAYNFMQTTTCFEQGPDNEIYQFTFIDEPKFDTDTSPLVDFTLNKPIKGSIRFTEDKSCTDGKRYLQTISYYRNAGKKYSTSIFDTKHSHVKVSQSRVTVTMSFPLCDDPQRLTARLQNFANVIIDESDEIAAMLNQEGASRVQEAWQTLAEENAQ